MHAMASQTISTLSFDVVGTLIDVDAGVREWFRHHMRDHDRQASDEDIRSAFNDAAATLGEAHPELSFTALLPRVYGHIARAWELDTDESAALDFRDSIRDWPAFRDAIPALRQLGEQYPLAAVTHADTWGMEAMAQTLGEPFCLQVTSDSLASEQRAGDLWSVLCAQLACAPGAVLHCTAGTDTSAASARAAGLNVVRVQRPAVPPAAEAAASDEAAGSDEPLRDLHGLVEYLREAAAE